jgi:hypothetical protein
MKKTTKAIELKAQPTPPLAPGTSMEDLSPPATGVENTVCCGSSMATGTIASCIPISRRSRHHRHSRLARAFSTLPWWPMSSTIMRTCWTSSSIGRAVQARAKAKEQREAVQAQWYGRWYRRARPSEELGWVGERQMWLEPQPWVLIGGCVPPEKIATLVVAVDELARRPSPIGALQQSHPDLTMKDEPGTGTNGGIFAAINGILVGLSH